ncbi:MAG: isopentenyl phosphate kinase [Methanomicrobiaceae archaeon]|nr:isopentenyl phosphate kinase [Methanomicrobiaceae archaeon]
MKERVLVKLGGSIITDKSGDCEINHERLSGIARAICARNGNDLILVHGAGSCGHPEAKRHHLDIGLDQHNKQGIYVTHHAVRALNDAVVSALRAHGAEAIGIHPLDACVANNGRIISFECGAVELLVQHGIIPVLHGDVGMDRSRGACIISGDQLVRYLPQVLQIHRIGLATDVPGVLDGDNSVVRRIDRATACELNIGMSGNTDVTGGMKGKIEELLALAESGIVSHIFHVSRLADFLAGRDHGGTRVCPTGQD